ncbi:MFS transporter [Acinetobacter pittii]
MKTTTKELDKKVIWHIMPLLLICYFFANLDKINIGFAKMQISSELGFSDTVYGFGAGLFFVAYSLFGVPSNIALEKIGTKKWICILMIIWGSISSCMFLISTPIEFYILRFLLGMAEAGFFPGIMLYITRWFPSRKRATMTAWFMLAVPMSGVIGGPLSGIIIDTFHNTYNMQGWQWMFILEGIPVILLGLIIFKFLPENIDSVKWLTEDEKLQLKNEINHEEKKKIFAIDSIFTILVNKYIWILIAVYFSIRLGVSTMAFWMPTFIHSAGIKSNSMTGILSSIPYIMGVVSMIILGYTSDKFTERRFHLIIPVLCISIGLALAGLFSNQITIVMIGMSLVGVGVSSSLPIYWQLPQSFLTVKTQAAGIALISSFGSVASFTAPYLIGFVKDHVVNQNLGLYIISGFILCSSLLFFIIPKKSIQV